MAGVTIEAHGPVFDGRADRYLEDAAQQWATTLAEHGAGMVRTNLNKVLRHQTPYYRLQVVARPEAGGAKVTDQGVIYGPWLEGVGSRNRTTRFKGYFTFRRTTQELDRQAVPIGKPIIDRAVDRCNA